MKNEVRHTAHSSYRCEYHIVFAPKYRRREIYGALKKDIGEIIRKLCCEKKVEIIEAEACVESYPYACKYTTIHKYSTVHGISQGKKYANDI